MNNFLTILFTIWLMLQFTILGAQSINTSPNTIDCGTPNYGFVIDSTYHVVKKHGRIIENNKYIYF